MNFDNHPYENRVRNIVIGGRVLTDLFKLGRQNFEVCENPLPSDAILINAHYQASTNQVVLQFYSKEFDPVPEGNVVSSITPYFRSFHPNLMTPGQLLEWAASFNHDSPQPARIQTKGQS